LPKLNGRVGSRRRAAQPFIIGDQTRITFLTWNTNALLSVDPHKARAREGIATSLMMQADFTNLQETHGTEESAQRFLERQDKTHFSYASVHSSPNAGGVISMVKKSILPMGARPTFKVLVPGRVLSTVITIGNTFIANLNVHNFGLTQEEHRLISDYVAGLKRQQSDDPSGKSFVVINGDFNFLAPGERAFHIDDNSPPDFDSRPPPYSTELRRWLPVLENMTEAFQPEPTRLGLSAIREAGADADADPHHGLVATRLDRMYVSIPPWRMMLLKAQAKTTHNLVQLKRSGISDHCPVKLTIGSRQALPKDQLPIPSWVAKHPKFAEHLAALQEATDLESMQPFERLAAHKRLIRQASDITLKDLLSKPADTLDQKIQVLLQAGRTVYFVRSCFFLSVPSRA